MSRGDILNIADEQNIILLVHMYLAREGYGTLSARTGAEALDIMSRQSPALVILDIMLPDIDGWEVCREIRRSSDVPIIMLTAREADEDKIVGLEIGADDYVTKPFVTRELMARVKAILRRVKNSPPPEED